MCLKNSDICQSSYLRLSQPLILDMFNSKAIIVVKRAYSDASNINADFLKNVLNRVSNLTIRPPVKPQTQQRKLKNPSRKFPRKSESDKFVKSSNKSQNNSYSKSVSRKSIVNVKSKSEKKLSSFTNGEYADLATSINQQSFTPTYKKGPKKTKNTIPGLVMSDKSVEDKISLNSKFFVPEDPNIVSLIKYNPNLDNNITSRLKSYGLRTLNEAQFPINRPFNNGIMSNSQKACINYRIVPSKESFGKYMPNGSFKYELEPLTKNFKILPQLNEINSIIHGEYNPLKPIQKDKFVALSNSETKIESLVKNSEITRLSLEQSNMNQSNKELLHQVCSGLKNISELRF